MGVGWPVQRSLLSRNIPWRIGKFRHSRWRDIPGRSGTTQVSLKKRVFQFPTTTDELIAAAKAIRAAGDRPIIASGSDGMGLYLFTLTCKREMTDEEAKACMVKGHRTVPSRSKGHRAICPSYVMLEVFVDSVEGIDLPPANTNTLKGCGHAEPLLGPGVSVKPEVAPLTPDIQLGGFPLPAGSPHQAPGLLFSHSAPKGYGSPPTALTKIDAVRNSSSSSTSLRYSRGLYENRLA